MRHGRPDARRLKTIEGESESAPDGEVVQWAHDSVAALLQDVEIMVVLTSACPSRAWMVRMPVPRCRR